MYVPGVPNYPKNSREMAKDDEKSRKTWGLVHEHFKTSVYHQNTKSKMKHKTVPLLRRNVGEPVRLTKWVHCICGEVVGVGHVNQCTACLTDLRLSWVCGDRLRSTAQALQANNVIPRNVRFEIESLDKPLPVELLRPVLVSVAFPFAGSVGDVVPGECPPVLSHALMALPGRGGPGVAANTGDSAPRL